MSKQEKKVAGGVANASFSYGTKGWGILIFSMFMYFICAFPAIDGMNIYTPIAIEHFSWNSGMVYTLNTIAGWVAIPLTFIFSWIMTKSTRVCIILSLICGIIGSFWFGVMQNMWEMFFIMLLFQLVSNGAMFMGTSNLIANWFPTRKGTAMGWATIGASLNTTFNPTIWTVLTAVLGAGFIGLSGTFRVWGIAFIILLVICLLFIRNNPEDAGAWPDNDKTIPLEVAKRNRELGYLYKKSSPWTVGKLLKCKQMWIICIASGVIMLITTGIISNFLAIVMSNGFTDRQGLLVMAVASAIGAVFSVIWGKVDAVKGTKWACISFYVIMAIALIMMMIPSKATMFIGSVFVGCSLGAGNNLMASMTGTVFGRYDFDKAWGIIYPIHVVLRSAGFAVVGYLSSATGSFRVPFVVMLVLSIVAILVVRQLDDRMIGRVTVSEEELAAAQAAMKK